MLSLEHLTDFQIADANGVAHPFRVLLAEFNILAFRRVPTPSHGPATGCLERLLAEYCSAEAVTVRAFDIRSSDSPCDACPSPHVVYTGPVLMTICDGDGSLFRRFGAVGNDHLFTVRSAPQECGGGTIEDIGCWVAQSSRDATAPTSDFARAPPRPQSAGHRGTAA